MDIDALYDYNNKDNDDEHDNTTIQTYKVAIELTLSRNYNKYDIIIFEAHL